jgi:hypothetical protein
MRLRMSRPIRFVGVHGVEDSFQVLFIPCLPIRWGVGTADV